jgi:hypothetical protein
LLTVLLVLGLAALLIEHSMSPESWPPSSITTLP